jgi:hypothetical protein
MEYLKIIVLSVVCPIYINAQNVMDICETHVEKLGGVDNIDKVENISIEQTVYSNNREVPQTALIFPNKVYYQEVNFQPGKYIICVVEGKGWAINSYVSAKAVDLSEQEASIYMINSNVFGPLYDYYVNREKSIVKEILLEGEKYIDRDNCYKLKVIYKSEFITHVYVSKESFMIRKSENNSGSMAYSDYKKVNKVMFPFNTEIVNAMGVMKGEVINLKTNVKIDHDKFNKP